MKNRRNQLCKRFEKLFIRKWGSDRGIDKQYLSQATTRQLANTIKVFQTYIEQQEAITA